MTHELNHEADDPAFCNYCDVDFQSGDEVRKHRAGRYIHEVCFQERRAINKKAEKHYALFSEVWQAETS